MCPFACSEWAPCRLLQVVTKIKCSAERFKWLWAIQGVLEKIMLRECKTVAETFVGYCGRLAREGAAAVGPHASPGQCSMRSGFACGVRNGWRRLACCCRV